MGIIKTTIDDFLYASKQLKNLPKLNQKRQSKNPDSKSVTIYHGFGVANIYLHDIMDYLEKKKYSVRAPNFNSFKDITEISEEQAYRIHLRINETGKKESLIGHSQGGLVAVYIAQKHPDLIDKVIALGTPFRGTKVAYLASFTKAGRQMCPDSKFLKEMRSRGLPGNVNFYTITSPDEHLVIPRENALLNSSFPNIKNIKGPKNIGHAKLITLHNTILNILKE